MRSKGTPSSLYPEKEKHQTTISVQMGDLNVTVLELEGQQVHGGQTFPLAYRCDSNEATMGEATSWMAKNASRLSSQATQHGAVFHHTAPFAPDVHRFIDQAIPAGMEQIGSIPPKEVTTRATAWFHPRACLGMLLEPWNRLPGGEHYKA